MMALYGDSDTALRQFKNRMENNPEDAMARYGYGLALVRAGNPKAALDHLAVAREKIPDDADLAIDFGIACFQAGRYAEALDVFENESPSAAAARTTQMYLGRTLLALEQYEAAAGTFERIIKDDPENAEAYFYLGKTEGKRNNLARAHYNLGQSDLKNKNPQNAKFHFTKALEYEKDPARIEEINQLLKDMEKPRRFFGGGDKPDSKTDQKTEPSGKFKWNPLRISNSPY
jgi:tetratricopeptide (TPR) repeat protein